MTRIGLSIAMGLALCLGMPSLGHAQVVPDAGYGTHSHHPHPFVFLSGSCGSHHLNDATGRAHYVYRGYAWLFDLQKYHEDHFYVYYHEVGDPDYRWAFAKHATCHGIVRVYHKFPEHHHWCYFHGAQRKILGPQAYGTEELRKSR